MNYYELLGIYQDSSAEEIKAAYRRLAMKLHPDMNKDKEAATKKFIEVQKAYETLFDPIKRQQYNILHPQKKKKPKPKNKKYPHNKPEKKDPNFRFGITHDAPPRKVDVWGDPIEQEWKWDAYAGQYESGESPDIRGMR